MKMQSPHLLLALVGFASALPHALADSTHAPQPSQLYKMVSNVLHPSAAGGSCEALFRISFATHKYSRNTQAAATLLNDTIASELRYSDARTRLFEDAANSDVDLPRARIDDLQVKEQLLAHSLQWFRESFDARAFTEALLPLSPPERTVLYLSLLLKLPTQFAREKFLSTRYTHPSLKRPASWSLLARLEAGLFGRFPMTLEEKRIAWQTGKPRAIKDSEKTKIIAATLRLMAASESEQDRSKVMDTARQLIELEFTDQLDSGKKARLSVYLDIFSKRPIGYRLSEKDIEQILIIETLIDLRGDRY